MRRGRRFHISTFTSFPGMPAMFQIRVAVFATSFPDAAWTAYFGPSSPERLDERDYNYGP